MGRVTGRDDGGIARRRDAGVDDRAESLVAPTRQRTPSIPTPFSPATLPRRSGVTLFESRTSAAIVVPHFRFRLPVTRRCAKEIQFCYQVKRAGGWLTYRRSLSSCNRAFPSAPKAPLSLVAVLTLQPSVRIRNSHPSTIREKSDFEKLITLHYLNIKLVIGSLFLDYSIGLFKQYPHMHFI